MRYNTFTIQNFRGIEKLTIKDLKMINLLVGRNNCGKTSVLEAFFLLSGMSNPQLPINFHNLRDLILTNDEDFSYMFINLDFNVPVTITANLTQGKRKLIIKPLYYDYKSIKSDKQIISKKGSLSASDSFSSTTSFSRLVEGVKLEFDDGASKKYNARFSIKEKEIFVDKNYKETLRCSFINRKTIDKLIDKQMERLLVQKQLNSIISILQEIEPNVSDIRMGAGGMIYIDIGQKNLLPINIMGDGIRRLLSILAYIADMKNGIVLIEHFL